MRWQQVAEASVAASERMRALVGDGSDTRELDDSEVMVAFAGMDVPGHAVMAALHDMAESMADAQEDELGVRPDEAVLLGALLNGFLFGFEVRARQ